MAVAELSRDRNDTALKNLKYGLSGPLQGKFAHLSGQRYLFISLLISRNIIYDRAL